MVRHPNDYAMVIGINDYPFYGSPLKGSIDGALAIHRWLCWEDGGGLDAKHTRLITSRERPPHPGRDPIDMAFSDLISSIEGDARRLYVYFSGHGLARGTLEADLCTALWCFQHRGMALDTADYRKAIVSFGKFSEIVFWLDCCRSDIGGVGSKCGFGLASPAPRAKEAEVLVAFATLYTDSAFEAKQPTMVHIAGEPMPLWGYFSQALLQGLLGEAAD